MNCPRCHTQLSPVTSGSQVVETRYRADGKSIRRRRQCTTCAHKFTTREYTVQALQATLDLKKTILNNQLVEKVEFALEDIETLTANLMELRVMLKEQTVEAQMIDCGFKTRSERHVAL